MPFARGEGPVDIYYEVHGETGSAVVLSAGMGGSGHFWTPQLERLAEAHRVVVYDHVGTGRSARDPVGELSIERMARDIVAVLDAAGIGRAHVVGHAIGGIVGLALALAEPDRLLGLVVVNGWDRADAHLRRCFAVRKEILLKSGPAAYVRAQPLFLFPPRWIAENDARLEAEAGPMIAQFPSTAVLLRRIDLFLAFDAGDRLRDIRTPTLIVSSLDDTLVPSYLSERLAARIPGALNRVFAQGGHALTIVTPGPFNEAVAGFIADQDRRRDAASERAD